MSKLEGLVLAARETPAGWDEDRSRRVLGETLVRRERRAARDRFLRRAAAGSALTGLLCVVLLRGASAGDASTISAPETVASHAVTASSDAGYARD
jgi:hypothetical protein